ncbi:MAG: 50S ribosomal protein L23 [Candidatus Cloacimonetes bacterium]|nr:50S ribosomal protein L23 [Candidatus Cloacimonadota bacterium]
MNLNNTDILLRPLMSEKAYVESNLNKYRFAVHTKANKIQIKGAVEELFRVKVVDVNVHTMKGKRKRFGRYHAMGADWKKAVVTLQDGQTLDFFEKA